MAGTRRGRHFEDGLHGSAGRVIGTLRPAPNADSSVRAGGEIVVLRCAGAPVTGIASLSHRGGTAWPILTAEARCWNPYENAAVIVSGIVADELGQPTPCPKYDVAGLIEHLVESGPPGGRLSAAGRQPPPGDESAHVELSDAPGQLRSAAEQAAQSWGDNSSLSLSTQCRGRGVRGGPPCGHVPGRAGRTRLGLGRATGQIDKLDPSLALPALEGARAMIKPQYRNMVEPGAPFGAEVYPAPGADDWERLAAFMDATHGQTLVHKWRAGRRPSIDMAS